MIKPATLVGGFYIFSHMTNLILFDDSRENLLPLTFTRPVANIRIGILTIREKWEIAFNTTSSTLTSSYLSIKFPIHLEDENLLINGSVIPDIDLLTKIKKLHSGEILMQNGKKLALRLNRSDAEKFSANQMINTKEIEHQDQITCIEFPWDIFHHNWKALKYDYSVITKGRKSDALNKSVTVIGSQPIFLEKGAKIIASVINTTEGPVYIGREAEVMEGCLIRGPFSLGNNSQLKMGTKIYGPTTIGPHCKVGGEVNNSVIFGFSNKAHEGFIGQTVIGEWCNLGADTNTSNLKNDYSEVKVWSYEKKSFQKTGKQFCGTIMGDHSKTSINTMLNTGAVIGVCCNVFGEGFPRNFVPDFSWGGKSGFSTYQTDKAFKVAEVVMQRRNMILEENDKSILSNVFKLTKEFRQG